MMLLPSVVSNLYSDSRFASLYIPSNSTSYIFYANQQIHVVGGFNYFKLCTGLKGNMARATLREIQIALLSATCISVRANSLVRSFPHFAKVDASFGLCLDLLSSKRFRQFHGLSVTVSCNGD